MLSFTLGKDCLGITIWGDQDSLLNLQRAVYDIHDGSPALSKKDDTLLGFTGGLRYAIDGYRAVEKHQDSHKNGVTRYGADLYWPDIFLYSRMLRRGLGFMPSSLWHQATIYELEHIVESAVHREFGGMAEQVLSAWLNLELVNYHDVVRSRIALFLEWSPTQRRKLLADLLRSFNPMYWDFKNAKIERSSFEGVWTHCLPEARWSSPRVAAS
jgi:hypothetical protein